MSRRRPLARDMLPDLRHRRLVPELMDDPGLDAAEHARALRGLARLNALSRAAGVIWGPVRRLAGVLGRPVRVLDVATGGGDIAIGLCARARRAGVVLEAAGCDISQRAIEHARERAARAGVAARFFVADAIHEDLGAEYDAVVCSLFLHHLDESSARRVLSRMGACAERLVIVSDLVRSRRAWAAVRLGVMVTTRSRVVRVDSDRSVRAAFTAEELGQLAASAGLSGATVERMWPAQMRLLWTRKGCLPSKRGTS